MISCEATGKTIEQAIENALLELKAVREDVDIKVINQGGFLKKAKVVVTISEEAREKYEKKAEKKKQEKIQEESVEKEFSEEFMQKKIEKNEKESKKQENLNEKTEKNTEKSEKTQVEEKKENLEFKKKSPQKFLEEVLECLGLQATIEKSENDGYVTYSLDGENLSELIGHHGEGLNSLEYLMRLSCFEENHKKILLDIGGYRVHRAESLTELAKRVADKVAKTGRYHKFEPMTASERKVIHSALAGDDRVMTMSKGEEPQRYLIVFPQNYEE